MANILLINSSWRPAYKNILSLLVFQPVSNLATIAERAKKNSHKINITNLSFWKITLTFVLNTVKKDAYNVLGFTGTTLLFPHFRLRTGFLLDISRLAYRENGETIRKDPITNWIKDYYYVSK